MSSWCGVFLTALYCVLFGDAWVGVPANACHRFACQDLGILLILHVSSPNVVTAVIILLSLCSWQWIAEAKRKRVSVLTAFTFWVLPACTHTSWEKLMNKAASVSISISGTRPLRR